MQALHIVLGCALAIQQGGFPPRPAATAETGGQKSLLAPPSRDPDLPALSGGRPAPALTDLSPAAPSPALSVRAAPPDLVAEVLSPPVGGTLTGRLLTLAEALASARTRAQQLEVTHAYWRLTQAVGEYRQRFDEADRLRRFEARSEDGPMLRSARASAVAALRGAEVAAVRAQHELAEAAGLPAGVPLPLPADPPHVGSYRTNYDEVFAARSVPPRARLIHRVLPLRREGIDFRAAAVQAAEDAVLAAGDAYRGKEVDFSGFVACLAFWGEQRRALAADACRYNHDIADYALTVIGSPVSSQALVAMLIKPRQAAPAPAPPAVPARIPPSQSRSGVDQPSAVQPSGPVPRTANRLQLQPPAASGGAASLYPALEAAAPAVRAKQLSQALHWDRSLPPKAGEAIDLRDCLRRIPASLRQPAIDAYWLGRQRAAEYQVLVAAKEWLDQLAPEALEQRSRPGEPEAMLRLRAARIAAEADLREAHVQLLEAQFELTRLVGRPFTSTWLLPSTPPHAGTYDLRLEAQPRQLAESRPLRRLAVAIPALAESVQDRAAAVVEADAARAAATAAYQARSRSLDPLLACIQYQTVETLAFLETLTGYNRAIGEYALTVLPTSTASDQLVQALVVTQ